MNTFWENVTKYPKFLILSIVGLITTILNPIILLTKKGSINRFIVVIFLMISSFILVNILALMFNV
nr:Ycf33 [Meringosphaera mediterranea]